VPHESHRLIVRSYALGFLIGKPALICMNA
jgi:hypothetical protein